ncbi:putative Transposable element Tc1 transposase-like 28, partial [Homarus americanus]
RLTTRGQIIVLREEGLTVLAIVDRLAFLTSPVKRWIRRYAETGNLTDLEDHAPRLTTRDEDVALIVAIQNNPFSNAVAIREALHLDVCTQTVRSRLHEAGIQHRVPAIRERQTEQHRTGRLQFAQQYGGVDPEFWSRVVFTDDKTFASTNHDTTGPTYKRWLEVGM